MKTWKTILFSAVLPFAPAACGAGSEDNAGGGDWGWGDGDGDPRDARGDGDAGAPSDGGGWDGDWQGGDGAGEGAGSGDAGGGGDAAGDDARPDGAADPAQAPGPTVDVNLGQGGAQDFGAFRQVIEAGGLPLPGLLDDVGFFNEHHVPLPAPDCGEPICVHGLLGVMGNLINGAGCTMLQLGMNARVPADRLQARRLNLVVAVDVSGSMRQDDRLGFVQAGLAKLVEGLDDEDTVTLIAWSDLARVVVEGVGGVDKQRLSDAIGRLNANGNTNLYDGLQLALEMGSRYYEVGRDNRVILLTDGEPTVGITNDGEIVQMARRRLLEGMGLTTIGVGQGARLELLRRLAEIGAGNLYFIEDIAAAVEVFTEEIHTFITPIATDIRLELQTGGAYGLREIMGTRQWQAEGDRGAIEIDSLFVAHRQSHDDQEAGRRGGGGAILAELMPVRGWQGLDGVDPGIIARLTLSYLPEGEVLRRTSETVVRYPHAPDELLEGGYFAAAATAGSVGEGSAASAEKAFVALNLFVGLRMASELVAVDDLPLALTTLQALETEVAAWLSVTHDEDIEDDLALLRLFVRNLMQAGAADDPTPTPTPTPPPPPPNPWPRD